MTFGQLSSAGEMVVDETSWFPDTFLVAETHARSLFTEAYFDCRCKWKPL